MEDQRDALMHQVMDQFVNQVRNWHAQRPGVHSYHDLVASHQDDIYNAFMRSGLQPFEFHTMLHRASEYGLVDDIKSLWAEVGTTFLKMRASYMPPQPAVAHPSQVAAHAATSDLAAALQQQLQLQHAWSQAAAYQQHAAQQQQLYKQLQQQAAAQQRQSLANGLGQQVAPPPPPPRTSNTGGAAMQPYNPPMSRGGPAAAGVAAAAAVRGGVAASVQARDAASSNDQQDRKLASVAAGGARKMTAAGTSQQATQQPGLTANGHAMQQQAQQYMAAAGMSPVVQPHAQQPKNQAPAVAQQQAAAAYLQQQAAHAQAHQQVAAQSGAANGYITAWRAAAVQQQQQQQAAAAVAAAAVGSPLPAAYTQQGLPGMRAMAAANGTPLHGTTAARQLQLSGAAPLAGNGAMQLSATPPSEPSPRAASWTSSQSNGTPHDMPGGMHELADTGASHAAGAGHMEAMELLPSGLLDDVYEQGDAIVSFAPSANNTSSNSLPSAGGMRAAAAIGAAGLQAPVSQQSVIGSPVVGPSSPGAAVIPPTIGLGTIQLGSQQAPPQQQPVGSQPLQQPAGTQQDAEVPAPQPPSRTSSWGNGTAIGQPPAPPAEAAVQQAQAPQQPRSMAQVLAAASAVAPAAAAVTPPAMSAQVMQQQAPQMNGLTAAVTPAAPKIALPMATAPAGPTSGASSPPVASPQRQAAVATQQQAGKPEGGSGSSSASPPGAPAPAAATPAQPTYAQKLEQEWPSLKSNAVRPAPTGTRVAPAPKTEAQIAAEQAAAAQQARAAAAAVAAVQQQAHQSIDEWAGPVVAASGGKPRAGAGGASKWPLTARLINAYRQGASLQSLLKLVAAERQDLQTALNDRIRSWLTQDCDGATAECLAIFVLGNLRRDWHSNAKSPGAFLMGMLQHRAQLLGHGLARKLLEVAKHYPNVAMCVDSDVIQELGEMEPALRSFLTTEYLCKQRHDWPEGLKFPSQCLLSCMRSIRYADPVIHRSYQRLQAERPDLAKAMNGVILYGLCKCDTATGLAAIKRLSELPEDWTSAARVNASAFLYQKVQELCGHSHGGAHGM